ncbi:MAG TPA: ATP-binding protein [Rhizobacter sp.]|nr:ATP-binding protein [Rhizobacter sp.]
MAELSASMRRSSHAGEPRERWSDSVWQHMFEQMADICIWVEPGSGRIIGCNAAFVDFFQYKRAEVQGLALSSLAQPDDLRTSEAAWLAMARGDELSDTDVTALAKDGSAVRVSVRSSTILGREGKRVCGLTVWRDMRQRHESERALVDNRRRLQTLAYELTVAEARERGRIAQGLHDEIGQLLAMAKLKLAEWGASAPTETPQRDAVFQDELRELLSQAARAVRSATFDLSCPLLRQFGLQMAIESLGDRIERSSAMAVAVEGALPALPLPEGVLAVIYRVVRELALNAQKHAQARQLRITLGVDGEGLFVRVQDDGQGFDCTPLPPSFGPEGGFGLVSGEAQMQAIGGRMAISSRLGHGTCATVSLPLPA